MYCSTPNTGQSIQEMYENTLRMNFSWISIDSKDKRMAIAEATKNNAPARNIEFRSMGFLRVRLVS